MRSILPITVIVVLAAWAGCRAPWANRLILPDQNIVVREQLIFHSDFALPPHHRLLDEVVAQRADLNRRLGLPGSDEPIHVYLFENVERFKGFMKIYHPDFPERRAFFVETDTKLSVYAQWGDRVAEDLRHEITHGYLHSTVPNLPLWLDEGLAEFYEAPRNERGLNRSNLNLLAERLQHEHWRPDLKRLEQLDPDQGNVAGRLCGGLGMGSFYAGVEFGICRLAAGLFRRPAARCDLSGLIRALDGLDCRS